MGASSCLGKNINLITTSFTSRLRSSCVNIILPRLPSRIQSKRFSKQSEVTYAKLMADTETNVQPLKSNETGKFENLKSLEELNWKSTFVDELPGDSVEGGPVRQVRNACYSFVRPSLDVKDPSLLAFSTELAETIGLDPSEFERPEFVQIFLGAFVPKGSKPYAQCYGGHQFGHWAGQLGDGRAITLGEVLSPEGSSLELQLKGAGKTPYSRMADGRAVLRSSIREFLASESLHWLGIPTTRALSLISSGEKVLRDMFYKGGLEADLGRRLADYVIKYHFPQFQDLPTPEREAVVEEEQGEEEEVEVDVTENKYAAWFAEVAERTGRLVAMWQSVGFTHGVLNTDNMSILGLTIDYGPFGFLDAFDPRYTPNTTDLPGRRYCFQAQPDVGLWNVVQLANALVTLKLISVKEAQFAVSRYAETFMGEYRAKMTAKLGLKSYDQEKFKKLQGLMSEDKVDFTNFFRSLSGIPSKSEASEEELLAPLLSVLGEIKEERKKAWVEWLQWYSSQLSSEGVSEEERRQQMNSVNPKFILRNYLCQNAIEAAEAGNYEELTQLYEVLKKPYDEQPGMEKYTATPPEWANQLGVCMLSCSS